MNDRYKFEEKDRPIAVVVDPTQNLVSVTLADGRIISNPLDWHPWLADATPEQQANAVCDLFTVDWPDLDEGLDIEGMLRGIKPKTRAIVQK